MAFGFLVTRLGPMLLGLFAGKLETLFGILCGNFSHKVNPNSLCQACRETPAVTGAEQSTFLPQTWDIAPTLKYGGGGWWCYV